MKCPQGRPLNSQGLANSSGNLASADRVAGWRGSPVWAVWTSPVTSVGEESVADRHTDKHTYRSPQLLCLSLQTQRLRSLSPDDSQFGLGSKGRSSKCSPTPCRSVNSLRMVFCCHDGDGCRGVADG